MRPKHVVYDDLLRVQADLSFDLEQAIFQTSPSWRAARRVLDFGAGNGYYTRLLTQAAPEKTFVAMDRDQRLAERAKAYLAGRQAEVVAGSYTDRRRGGLFDFVLCRHVLSYLDDRDGFMRWVESNTTDSAGLVVIDANDSELFISPSLPLLEAGNEDFKRRVMDSGGCREVVSSVSVEWLALGFTLKKEISLVVHSAIRERRPLAYLFMLLVAEYDHGSPLDAEIKGEIDSWMRDPQSYFQFGVKLHLYQKEA